MKAKYRIRNWNDYNKSLIQRGSITVWFSEDYIKKWTAPKEIGKKGGPKLYSGQSCPSGQEMYKSGRGLYPSHLNFEKTPPLREGSPNASKRREDDAIVTALIIRSVFHLPLRALEGFLSSLVMILSVGLPIPSYTQICRRAKLLGQELKKLSRKNVTNIVIDSTGLKVYGEGEWKVRQHGISKKANMEKAPSGSLS